MELPVQGGRGRSHRLHAQCAACHGPEGRGAVGSQLSNPVFLETANDEFLYRTIAFGKRDTMMRGFLKGAPGGALMPMSEEDIGHIIAYLRRLQSNPTVDPPKRPHLSTDEDLGRDLYENKASCAKCHGSQGEGASGPALGNPDFLRVASDGFLAGTILLGREGTEMLSYGRGGNVKLTPQEVEAIVAYVRAFENSPPTLRRRVDSSPTAVSKGRELWLNHCAGCHGSEGHGPQNNRMDGYAPSINNPEFLRAADDGFLLATIAMGRRGTPMRAFGIGAGGISELDAESIRSIVAYIRSWEEPGEPEPSDDGEENK
ncbi:MAG: c-type cytochrome [Planctomycetota bacterium]